MDVAAQQIQRKIQSIAQRGDDDEGDHVARHRAQLVEHAGDDAAGQHQGHQPGVGHDVAEIAGDAVVHRAEHRRDLSKALGVSAGADDQHQDSGHNNMKLV